MNRFFLFALIAATVCIAQRSALSGETATLYFRNGGYLAGEFLEHDSGDQVRWKSDLFDAPATFDVSGIEKVVFGKIQPPRNRQHTNPQVAHAPPNLVFAALNQAADFLSKAHATLEKAERATASGNANKVDTSVGARVQTTTGQVVFGNIQSLDDRWLAVSSARHGDFRIPREQLERIDGTSKNLRTVVDIASRFQDATVFGADRQRDDWTESISGWETTDKGANLFFPIDYQGPVMLEMVVSANRRPDFMVAFADRLIRSAPGVETWGDRLVAFRQGDEFKHQLLLDSFSERELALNIYLDWEHGRMAVYSGVTLLGEFIDDFNPSRKPKSVGIRNNGKDLTIEQFRVKTWNGRSVPIQSTDKHLVQTSSGSSIEGHISTIEDGQLLIAVDQEEEPRKLGLDTIDQILFSSAERHGDTSAPGIGTNTPPNDTKENLVARYEDGGLVTGRYLGTTADGLLVDAQGIDNPIQLPWKGAVSIRFGPVGEFADQSTNRSEMHGLVESPGYRSHGRVSSADANGHVMWQPANCSHTVPLNLSTNSKVTFDSVTATALDSQLTDELHLINGDVIPCRLLAIDANRVHVRFADGADGSVPRNALKGIRRQSILNDVYQGFKDDDVWHISSNNSNAFSLENGVLELRDAVSLSKDVSLPDRARVSFDAQWTGNCGLYVGFGADEAFEAVRRRTVNMGFAQELMEHEAKRPRDFYGELQLTRTGDVLSTGAFLRASGLLGQMFMNPQQGRPAKTSTLPVSDDTVVNVDLLIDRARRRYTIVANGKTLRTWKETARIDGPAIYFGLSHVDNQMDPFGMGSRVKHAKEKGGHVRISKLRISRWPGTLEADMKERLLTRRPGARPTTTTHVLRAFNGDSLRGSLVAVRNDKVLFKSRLETIAVPLDKVAEIIALRETTQPNPDAFSLDLHGGGNITLSPIQVTEELMIGDSPFAGRIGIPWKLVTQMNVANGPRRPRSSLVSWKLREPPELPEEWTAGEPTSPTPSPMIGKPAPELTLSLLDGETRKLSDYRGKTVILDFWATWCGPCVVGLPQVMEVAAERPDDVVLVAVNQDEDAETIETFLKTHGWSELNVALDDAGNAGRQYGVNGIPHTVVVAPNGIVQNVHVGASPTLKATLVEDIVAAGKKHH